MPRRCATASPHSRAQVGGGTQRRGDRRRLHQDRGREHGQRDQENFGAARLRRDALCAQLLRRRRRPACLPRRRRARHDQGADPPVLLAAVGLRHGVGRYPRHPRSRRSRCRSAEARSPTRQADRQRGSARRRDAEVAGQGVADGRRSRVHVRAHIRYAGTDTALVVPALYRCRPAEAAHRRRPRGDESGVRNRASRALRLHRRDQGAGGRGGLGRSRRRRREILRAGAAAHDGAAAGARRGGRGSTRPALARRPRVYLRATSSRPATRSTGPRSSSSRTRPSWSRTAGRPS